MKKSLVAVILPVICAAVLCGCADYQKLGEPAYTRLKQDLESEGVTVRDIQWKESGSVYLDIDLNNLDEASAKATSVRLIHRFEAFVKTGGLGFKVNSLTIQYRNPDVYISDISIDIPPDQQLPAAPAAGTATPNPPPTPAQSATGSMGQGSSSDPRRQIIQAMNNGDAETVCRLAKAHPDLYDAKGNEGRTPLQYAAGRGPKELVEALLAKGADPNAKADRGGTPLHYAAELGNKDIAELLLAKGAQVNTRNAAGATPLYQAVDHGRKDLVELLLAKGADVNAKADSGNTPLDWAAHDGRKDIAELLLAKGAQVDARNSVGMTPLHLAAYYGHKDVADLLLAKGANVNARTNAGMTPLHVASATGHADIAELLRTHGGKD
jgi:ankyrin repeat protein